MWTPASIGPPAGPADGNGSLMSAWISLIATALGALIAISGTTLADYMKSRRDEYRDLRQNKQQLSTEFILAATQAMRQPDQPPALS